jgi:hypothetical protein
MNPKLLTTAFSFLVAAAFVFFSSSFASAQSINLNNAPTLMAPGSTHQVSVGYNSPSGGVVQIQLFDSSWNLVDNGWKSVGQGNGSTNIQINVPSNAAVGDGYFWQGLVYTSGWNKIHESLKTGVSIGAEQSDSLDMSNAPLMLQPGNTYTISTDYFLQSDGIVQLQIFDSAWNKLDSPWANVDAGSGTHTFTVNIPSTATPGDGYLWQGVVYDPTWDHTFSDVVGGVSVGGSVAEYDPLPAGNWELDWADEFSGVGEPEAWYPLIAYNHEEYATATEKGIRWTGDTENTAWMYSTKSGNHWQDGEGNLVLRIVSNKTESNVHGDKVEAAYLLSGYPEAWDSSDPAANVRWAGKFVSPKETPLYISCRVRSDEVVGHSTWFAFWLFSETRAYNPDPTDGTEVDIIEIAKGAPDYLDKSFNVAHHWLQSGGSESKQFNTSSQPPSTQFVDVQDDQFHTYGLEWTTTKMTIYVDGVPCYTFTDNIPSDPFDMMLMLTMEFQVNAWDGNQGDGRVSGPFVSDNSQMREMSRAYVDFVRVYKKQ